MTDDSDICNKVCEKYIAPETCIIKENNSCHGGNICEDINKVKINAAKRICEDLKCKKNDVPVYAGHGGCGVCGGAGCASCGCC